ncbi:hypothetical protein [Photobacterium sanguinicancri]|uniref:Uncharacterized protein n=1 Tax=Photobacterium sanguinicancri TaxID=875932 RepID=A0ABX4FV16_9GAMM|nr:hypothetical protein [Photobacterium sanguinicancri]OZS42683.1 hypothetical protein ASV53_17195 [Photobacterium sanguinicancri]
MKILEVNQKKVTETKSLLLEIIKDPSSFRGIEALTPALRSQGGLAKFSNSKRDIVSCSLNTLKSASELLLDRGFIELDELRINAKNAIEAVVVGNKATKSTKTGLRHKVDEIESKLSTMQKSNFLLTTIISELRSELKKMAHSDDSSQQRNATYQSLNRKIEAKLSYVNHGEV